MMSLAVYKVVTLTARWLADSLHKGIENMDTYDVSGGV